jgi:dimethylglycine catabolism B
MRHAVAGLVYLVCHPRPDRFDTRRRDIALRPVDLDAVRLGAATSADFTWPARVSFDACVLCGRCDSLCPALAAGQPLRPRAIIQDLKRGLGISPAPVLVGTIVAPDTLWACTTCRACVDACWEVDRTPSCEDFKPVN